MTAPILPGAEPASFSGGPQGVLVLHGFTGSPGSMRGVAEALANQGYTVEMPLLPGHGTDVSDMIPTTFADWSAAAEEALQLLLSTCSAVGVVGLSMGGTLTAWLAERHPELVGVAFVNPLLEPVGSEMMEGVRALVDAGTDTFDAIGSDIAKEGVLELSYPATPLRPLLTLFAGVEEVSAKLGSISCPILLLSSREDHVVTPSNGDHLVASVSTPIERIWLERSYHVATVDHDREIVESQITAFFDRIFASA
ncbi:MAG: alpha/beta fold hydrolase [Actinobacteria bacterium]|nr:alpha/beta fold hydrolase [Actinomycetota bacterium]